MSNQFDEQLAVGRVYARLAVRRQRLNFSTQAILKMRAVAPRSYLSLSFGKQSIVLAHMLFQIAPPLPMFFLASGESWQMHNFAEVIESFVARWPINFTIIQTDHVYDGSNLDWDASRKAGEFDLQRMCKREEWDGWYWGLAKDESKARSFALSKSEPGTHPAIFRYTDGKYRCCPIMNWQLNDLAAYIDEYDLPMLEHYKRNGLQARTTARLTGRAARWGGLTAMKQTDLDAYNRLCKRFPELSLVDCHQ